MYYDTDIYKGLFGWAAVSHGVPIGTQSLDLGALMGFSTGHGNTAESQIPLYTEGGITHFDFSAAVPLTVGAFSITPNAHFQVNGDNATKFTSGTETDGNFVFTVGTTIAWSREFGGAEEEGAEESPY